MLTLSRKPGQTLILDLGQQQSILLTVTEVRGQQVKLSIDAPQQVTILREELLGHPANTANKSLAAYE